MLSITEGPHPFYILGGFNENPKRPWILGAYETLKDAERGVARQCVGPGDRLEWRIAKFNSNRKGFDILQGGYVDFPLSRGIYTREAYARVLESHGIPAHNMMEPTWSNTK